MGGTITDDARAQLIVDQARAQLITDEARPQLIVDCGTLAPADVPSNVLTWRGEPITFRGEYVTWR